MKIKLKIERQIEIEESLEELKNLSVTNLINKGYAPEELLFLCRAIRMPLNAITEYIEIYDNRPRVDELKFVKVLCEKYQTDQATLTMRIREVRRINKFRNNEETPKR
ncbi:MAG: hypothetical protein HFI49_02490 [Bacilli bacterium]|jgi:hypothetical protein|nr:hypothetical protein [Bacilli bacterium]